MMKKMVKEWTFRVVLCCVKIEFDQGDAKKIGVTATQIENLLRQGGDLDNVISSAVLNQQLSWHFVLLELKFYVIENSSASGKIIFANPMLRITFAHLYQLFVTT